MVYCQIWKEMRGAQTVGHKLTKPYVPSLSHTVCPAVLHMSTKTGTGMYSWSSCWGQCSSPSSPPVADLPAHPWAWSLECPLILRTHLTAGVVGWLTEDCAHRFLLLVPLGSQRSRENLGIWELSLTISTVSPSWFFSFSLDKFWNRPPPGAP